MTRARRAAWVLAAASLMCACPGPTARPKIAFFERVDPPRVIESNYYPLKVAARAGVVALIDSSGRLGFKSSRVIVLDAATGALVFRYDIPRATGRGGKASALDVDAQGRIYVAIEGADGTHLLRLTRQNTAPAAATPAARPAPTHALAPGAGVPSKAPAATAESARYSEEWDFIRGGKYPAGLRVGPGDEMLLVDGGNHRLIRVAWKGVDPFVLGSSRDLETPRGAAVAPDGSVCAKNGRPDAPFIACYDRAGKRATVFPLPGVAEALAWFYNDVVVGPDGKLYVTDYDKHRVRVFSLAGVHLGDVTDPALKGPMGIAFDEHARMYIADAWAKHVLRFVPVYEKEAAARAKAQRKAPAPRRKN